MTDFDEKYLHSDKTLPYFRRLLSGEVERFYKEKEIDMSFPDFVGLLKAFDTRVRTGKTQLRWGLNRHHGRAASLVKLRGSRTTHRVILSVPHMLDMVRAGKPEDVHAYLTTMEALLPNFPVTQ